MIVVKLINNRDTHPFLLYKHYAKRLPSISYSYGLFIDESLEGVCTFGQPGGACLSKGLFGGDYIKNILELNRLFINESVIVDCCASQFISKSIKLLPNNICIVSFADTSMGHVGKVYQASNFLYTGLSAKRTEWVIVGMEHLHSKSIADKASKGDGRWESLKKEYGDRLKKRDRSRKHRYVYIKAEKKIKKEMLRKLKYKIQDYPKGKTKRYLVNVGQNTQKSLF